MVDFDPYINPLLLPNSYHNYVPRRVILNAITKHLDWFQGTVLDIGCGDMPYKPLLLAPPSRALSYIGMDFANTNYRTPDLEWDGHRIPLNDNSVESALATEVLEHCADPEQLLREARRVLKPGGHFFFTVPFIWPLHLVPHDEYRYTPFALERHLKNAGFEQIELQALGGWDAALAQMIGQWVKRRPMSERRRAILRRVAIPVMRQLLRRDQVPQVFQESTMSPGFFGTAVKRGASSPEVSFPQAVA